MNPIPQNTCIGIDLGTTNSEVAFVHKGKPFVLKVNNSSIVPSVISINDNGEVLVGQAAVNNELVNPEKTIRCIKRKMGREEVILLNDKAYTPPMISSLILAKLKQAAETFLQQPITKAVITVPAFFNEKQREATKEAAELAGLEPLRLLNEPTAAALAYSLGKTQHERCLVYDLGGGTFDVSIVDFSEGLMEVKSSHGDTELGGADFDKMIAEKIRQAFLEEHKIDLFQNPLSWARLIRASEAAKIRLSNEAKAEIKEEFIAKNGDQSLHLQFEVTRSEFENMIRPTIERSLASVRKALEMAFLKAENLDRVILVGGSTFIPLVGHMLEHELHITPQAWLNPSTVVAMGAAVEAAKLSGLAIGPMMVDITPHSLGIECLTDHGLCTSILIRRNTPLPHTASDVFYKMHPDQEKIDLKVYQGESQYPHLNQLLGNFELDGLLNSGTEILVKFELDRSGLLHVTATEIATGKQQSKEIKRSNRSRVKHTNLADLESVKIVTETIPLEEGEEEDDYKQLDWLGISDRELDGLELCESEESEDSEAPEASDTPSASSEPVEDEALFKKAQVLMEADQIDSADKTELSNEVASAKAGDKKALERLMNLIYYLE
jgi:molecular chaperone DnaK